MEWYDDARGHHRRPELGKKQERPFTQAAPTGDAIMFQENDAYEPALTFSPRD